MTQDLDFSEKLFNESAISMLRAHIVNKQPFHLLISTCNWRPMLTEDTIEKRPIALMSFTDNILDLLDFDEDFNPILFLAMKNDKNTVIIHGLLTTPENCQIKAIYSDKNGEPDSCIFYRPEYTHLPDFYTRRFVFSLDEDIEHDDAEYDVQTSVSALFSHPDNHKFFD